LRRADLTWKQVKALLGKADPEQPAAPIKAWLELFAGVCDGEVIRVDADAVPIHRDRDSG
jgi:hypothetical protein